MIFSVQKTTYTHSSLVSPVQEQAFLAQRPRASQCAPYWTSTFSGRGADRPGPDGGDFIWGCRGSLHREENPGDSWVTPLSKFFLMCHFNEAVWSLAHPWTGSPVMGFKFLLDPWLSVTFLTCDMGRSNSFSRVQMCIAGRQDSPQSLNVTWSF